eukprot:COSAG03_NODE_3656_length_1895_cov_11.168151_2_plen_265_part_00
MAGLHAILPKLLALPKDILADRYADSAAAWAAALELLPPLALEECHWGEQTPPDLRATATRQHGSRVNMGCRTCAPNHNSTSCWCNGHMPCYPPTNKSTIVAIAGDYAGIREHNHENQACYSIWPFRQYAVGKPNVDIGVATYLPRTIYVKHSCVDFVCKYLCIYMHIYIYTHIHICCTAQVHSSAAPVHSQLVPGCCRCCGAGLGSGRCRSGCRARYGAPAVLCGRHGALPRVLAALRRLRACGGSPVHDADRSTRDASGTVG